MKFWKKIKGLKRKILSPERIMTWSLNKVCKTLKYYEIQEELEKVNKNIFDQYTGEIPNSEYYYRNIWNEHCFQADFTVEVLKKHVIKGSKSRLSLVDIGDSAGNHLKYIAQLLKKSGIEIEATSVNLDPVAVEKIIAKGGHAVLCRAEEYNPQTNIDCYLSYEMVEHLHNPALFFHRLAKADKGKFMIITVPYVKSSRVALRNSARESDEKITAENEHVFELSPEDLELLILHSGWRVIDKKIYLQYPEKIPFISSYLRKMWQSYDFEGFLGLALERDMSVADRYLDWED